MAKALIEAPLGYADFGFVLMRWSPEWEQAFASVRDHPEMQAISAHRLLRSDWMAVEVADARMLRKLLDPDND